MSEQKTHQMIVLWCVFNAVVILALLILMPVFAVLWLLLAVLAGMLYAIARPAVWQMEKERLGRVFKGIGRRLGGVQEKQEIKGLQYDLVSLNGGMRYPICQETFVIGRGSKCDCRLQDATISKEHCRILYRKYSREYYIEDLRSRNGTYLGTRRLEPFTQEKLLDNSELTIGECCFRFVKRQGS